MHDKHCSIISRICGNHSCCSDLYSSDRRIYDEFIGSYFLHHTIGNRYSLRLKKKVNEWVVLLSYYKIWDQPTKNISVKIRKNQVLSITFWQKQMPNFKPDRIFSIIYEINLSLLRYVSRINFEKLLKVIIGSNTCVSTIRLHRKLFHGGKSSYCNINIR